MRDGGEVINSFTTAITNNILDDDIATYIGGMVTPLSSAQLTKVNAQFIDMKAGLGITDADEAFDVWYYLGNETAESSLRNMVKRLHDAVAVNSPTFTPYEGFTGDGISMHINTNYNANTQGVRYTLNSATMGYYGRLNVNTGIPFGVYDNGGTTFSVIMGRNASNQFQVRINTAGAGVIGTNTAGYGMFIGSRTASNVTNGYRNSSIGTTKIDESVSMYSYTHYILAGHRSAGATQFSTQQVSLAFTGRGVAQAEVTTITNTFEALMDANGKGII
jgi:hypothetical protein